MSVATKISLSVGLLVSLAVAYYLISPFWRVVEVNEPSPMTTDIAPEPEAADRPDAEQPEVKTAPTGQTVDAQGSLIPEAHEASGQVLLIANADGSQTVRFENFEFLNGPDLRVYLSADTTNDDFIDLGSVKATKGSVNYDVPAGVDLTKYDTVLVWCRTFSVLFNYAELN